MQNKPSILVNGSAASHVNIADRGLLYGDGVFETMAWTGHSIRYFDKHLARLERGCQVLGLPMPAKATLTKEIGLLPDLHEPCIIKIILTRGTGGFGYTPAIPATTPTRIVQRLSTPERSAADTELRCAVLAMTMGGNRPLAGIKHLNRLEQVLAAREVATRGLDEGIICNVDGFVMEAVSSNLLVVFGDRLVTPRLDAGGVHGILREVLIERAQARGITVRKEYVYVDTLAEADEIILCNSIRGVRAVKQLDDVIFAQRDYFHMLNGLVEFD
ncbi:MAG: aminodeoxychorismate lyase [Gammaproteobacteria bacterium]|nr:aminodeoxychorismate lyase [Gammaproteobacteria bacterium]